MGFLEIAINGFKIEFELSKVFRSKFIDFEFKGDKALKFAMEKE